MFLRACAFGVLLATIHALRLRDLLWPRFRTPGLGDALLLPRIHVRHLADRLLPRVEARRFIARGRLAGLRLTGA